MFPLRLFVATLLILLPLTTTRAGLYYSGEALAELPSQWRGFLLDQRTLRNLVLKPLPGRPADPLRDKYEQEIAKLEKASRDHKLTADELADLGALYVRLGESAKAVDLLRTAQRTHPQHFRIAANLGTACQMQGDLDQAIAALQEAVKLAPGKYQKAEEAHLKLVQMRRKEARGETALDDLFGVKYVGADGKYEPGKIAEAERKKLPSEAVAVAQQLALWLPADSRLLWQLAELANAFGDVRTAAAMMDGCVTEFGLRHPDLRAHRQIARAAADELAKQPAAGDNAKTAHEAHGFKPKSIRPLLSRLDPTSLPAIKADGVNALPWGVLAETTVDRMFKPTFAKYAKDLDGKQVTLVGYMQPFGEDPRVSAFMLIEYPVGCWYCEMPQVTGIVLVEMPKGKARMLTKGPVRVEGTFKLNSTDPEDFLYAIKEATVRELD